MNYGLGKAKTIFSHIRFSCKFETYSIYKIIKKIIIKMSEKMKYSTRLVNGARKSMHPAATLLFVALTASSFSSVVCIVLVGTRHFAQHNQLQTVFSGRERNLLAGNPIACAGKCALYHDCVAFNWIPTRVSSDNNN